MRGLGLGLGLERQSLVDVAFQRMLDLIKNDTGTALFAPYSQADRLSNLFDGGPAPVDGGTLALELDVSKWDGKSYDQVMSAQPEGIANPDMAGGVSGVLGSGGQVPNGWSISAGGITDLTREVTYGVNPVTGNNYIDIRFSGTPSITGQVHVDPSSASPPAAAPHQYWTSHAWLSLVAGTLPGSVRVQTQSRNGGAYLAGIPRITGELSAIPELYAVNYHTAHLSTTQTYHIVSVDVTGGVPVDFTIRVEKPSLKRIPSRIARMGTASSRPKLYASPKPHLLFDGVDDNLDTVNLFPTPAGTMAVAIRPGPLSTVQSVLSGGAYTGDKRAILQVKGEGIPQFGFGADYTSWSSVGDHRGLDFTMVMSWNAAGRVRRYISTQPDPLVGDSVQTNALDGTGAAYRLGTNIGGTIEWLGGRIYGSLVRSVETSDADVRNIILPYFKGLMP